MNNVLRPTLFACMTLSAGIAVAQGLPQPPVGGNSSLPAGGGNGAGGAQRRVLSPMSVIPEDFSSLKLAPGFLLSMEVYDAPELSTSLRIDGEGNIQVPMVGDVHVADLTLVQSAALVAKALRDKKILTNPQVNVDIAEYAGQNITVLGEVRNPGRMELLAPHHLDDVLAMAGGETEVAGNVIQIRHQTGSNAETKEVRYSHGINDRVLNETLVMPGDTVTVERAGIVYVLGGVARPGGYVMQEGGQLDVTQALSLAYGTTMQAAVASIWVVHKLPDGKQETTRVPYRDMLKGKVPSPRLEPEDVVYVPLSRFKVGLGYISGYISTGVNAAVIYR